jgi:hypothetical protein
MKVKLLKDIPGCEAGFETVFNQDGLTMFGTTLYSSTDILNNRTFFEIIKNYFVPTKKFFAYTLTGTEDSYTDVLKKKKRSEVLTYFNALIENLNGDWKYVPGDYYHVLVASERGLSLAMLTTKYPVTKISTQVSLAKILELAQPEMVNAYLEILEDGII